MKANEKTIWIALASIGGSCIVSLLMSAAYLRGSGEYILKKEIREQVKKNHSTYRFFLPPADYIDRVGFRITPQGRTFKYTVLMDSNGYVSGIYVKFKGGDETYVAEIEARKYKAATITMSRGDGFGNFKIGKRKTYDEIRREEMLENADDADEEEY